MTHRQKKYNYDKALFNLSARFYNVLHLLSLANLNNEKAFETILTYCNIDNVSVLDIGCGTGIWSSFFLPHCSKIHGIDFSEKLLKKAKANIENPKISFELLSAFDIDKFPEKTFDIITASFFFHGLLSDERVEILHKVSYYFFALRYHKVWTSVYSFNEPSNNLLEKIGFEKEGVQKEMVFLNGQYFDKNLYGLTYERFENLYGEKYKI
jgi:SAM-dependent methyltransferase